MLTFPDTSSRQRVTFLRRELPPPPERLVRGPRRIRDGLWSPAGYTFDDSGHEICAKTHADGHIIMWPVSRPGDALLINPDLYVVDTPEARREAFAFAWFWGQA